MKYSWLMILSICAVTIAPASAQTVVPVEWQHLSTVNGDLPLSNGPQQTSSLVMDVDKDGINDFLISDRKTEVALIWMRRTDTGWERYVVEQGKLRIEAGSTCYDIDGDGDLDPVFGGDGSSNQVWWWENPYPNYEPDTPWTRHLIKDWGGKKQHDQMFGDFDGDGKTELVYWNQGSKSLVLSEIPEDPRNAGTWPYRKIYTYSTDSQMEQHGTYPGWRVVNEHEGFDACDIDGDGLEDIVGGGFWFKYSGDGQFVPNTIDAGYTFSRSAAGQLIEGGRPEVVLVIGDGIAPMYLYEWQKGTWVRRELLEAVDNGHSLDLVDFDGDGNLDIFNAEMRLGGNNEDAKLRILLGDGAGNFPRIVEIEGYGNHESRIADLDGDGDYDILGKPYAWETPRLDIWLNLTK